MSRILSAVMMAAAFAIFDTAANGQAFQQRDWRPNTRITVTCPAGTCSRVGTNKAYSLDRCSAANCKKKN